MLKKLKLNSEFSRNILTLMTGTTIAQAIPIAISPILTRLYSPSEFGLFALYMSVASVLSLIATGRYELAIMLPKKDSDALNIVGLSLAISFFVSFIAFLIVWIFNSEIIELLGNESISNWLYFIPITVLFTGIYQSLNYWNNRQKHYKTLAKANVTRSSMTAFSNLSIGYSHIFSNGLILGNLFGHFLSVLYLYKNTSNLNFDLVSKVKIFMFIKKYKKFPIYNLPNALIDGFRLSGVMILIAKYFSISSLGQFSLAWRMTQFPISIISGAFTQVFYQKISKMKHENLYQYVLKFIFKLSLISIVPFLFIYLYAESFFIFIFGTKWYLAGKLASILTPWMYLNFISSPLSMIMIKINKQNISLYISIIYMIIPLLILYMYSSENIECVVLKISYAMSIVLLVYIAIVLNLIKRKENDK